MADALGRYVEAGGVHCPRCGSEEIQSTDSMEMDAGIAWQDVECDICHLEWRDQYKLIGIQLLSPELLGPDGEFTKTQDYVERNDDGSWTIFQGCDGDWENCEDHWMDISLEVEDGKQVVYFRAHDNNGRRGNIAVPIDAVASFVAYYEVEQEAVLDYDVDGYLRIDPMDEMLYISTGPHGEFQMPFGDDGIAAINAILSVGMEG